MLCLKAVFVYLSVLFRLRVHTLLLFSHLISSLRSLALFVFQGIRTCQYVHEALPQQGGRKAVIPRRQSENETTVVEKEKGGSEGREREII